MKKQAARVDRHLDDRVNGAKAKELAAYGLPAYFLCVSPIECQALLAGVISSSIKDACRAFLKEPWER